MTAITSRRRFPTPATADPARRTRRDRPGWRFNAAVAAVLVVGGYLTFEPDLGLAGFVLLLGAWALLAVLGCLWLDRLVWCARHHRLGQGSTAVLAWLIAPLLVLGMLAFDRAVGGVEHLAFRLSEDEMERDARSRLATAEVDGFRWVGPVVGWLEIDEIMVHRLPAGTGCATEFVTYEVQQGFMSGSGYVFSPDGPPCVVEEADHLGGLWYWARLWD